MKDSIEASGRCWCGSMLKGKPHNCIATRGRVEALLTEVRLLHEAIDKSNVALEGAIKTQDELNATKLQNREMIPVVLAAVAFWKSDKGDTESEKRLFAAVEKFEETEENDILMWHIASKPKNEHCKNGPECAAYDCSCPCSGCVKMRDPEKPVQETPFTKEELKALQDSPFKVPMSEKRKCECGYSKEWQFHQPHCPEYRPKGM